MILFILAAALATIVAVPLVGGILVLQRKPLAESEFNKWAPDIVALPLPGKHDSFGSEISVVIFLFCCAGTFALIALIVSSGQGQALSARSATLLIVVLGVALFVTLQFLWKQWQTRRFCRRHLETTYASPYLKILQEAKIPQGSCSSTRSEQVINCLHAAFADKQITPPSVIVDMAFLLPLTNLEPLPGLPEPETVLSSSKRNISNSLITIFLGCIGLMFAILGGGFFCLAFGVFFLVTGLLPLPPARRLIRQFRRESKGLIAGPGFAVGPKGQIWNVDNSLALVRVAQMRPARSGSVDLQLLGPDGGKRMAFSSIRDPDFVCFWQRWTHPQPRTELAASVSADILPE